MRYLLRLLSIVALLIPTMSFADTYEEYVKGAGAYLNQDYRTAWRILKPLADQGQSNSQIYIGEMYWGGSGVRKNLVRAYMWITVAQKQINSKYEEYGVCAIDLERMAQTMTWQQIALAKNLAVSWRPISGNSKKNSK